MHVRLGENLGPIVTISNPLDYHTFIWGDLERTTDVFATMLGDYDAGLYPIDPPRPDRCDPAFPVSSLPENFDEALAD